MSYKDYTNYLFSQVPMFQNVGKDAYKEGLENTNILDEHFGHPHRKFHTIHVAGTNGKGSCSHTIASVLQEAGYKVGLFTSPHLVDFRERIRINGKMISEKYIMDFIDEEKKFFEPLHPTFFELTTAMAFKWFAEQGIDVAVIEVGLGGRLDCTNIINPDLSIITNISFDHTSLLGDTLSKIASEKAGIIKYRTPVIIGERHHETQGVFIATAYSQKSKIIFAEDKSFETEKYKFELQGLYQKKNLKTILTALFEMKDHIPYYNKISESDIKHGLQKVTENTGLSGRWQTLEKKPLTICDTGHNVGGFQFLSQQIVEQPCKLRRIVFGMVNDKDINGVLALLPKNAIYYFTQASVRRAMPAEELKKAAHKYRLSGNCFPNVRTAYVQAQKDADKDDFIFVGGSSFIVADLLTFLGLPDSKQ
ncbi:MAG: folylpolyglutamate synthase/dihydrofolate synthase family protein [Prevotellaceae bacterium]|nr:folylpolyglutamate synthase/dihydrofolate synthase family protein [Prevotellaceae bacterium]